MRGEDYIPDNEQDVAQEEMERESKYKVELERERVVNYE